MLLHIDDQATIGDLKDKFSRCFPNLKLVFCKKRHKWEGICPETMMWEDDRLPLSQIRKEHNHGVLELRSSFKVGEVEKAFRNQFDLNVQICFRSGSRWVQTGKMDNVTISELQRSAYQEHPPVLL